MNLDPRTLLFSLILTDALMMLGLLVAVHGTTDEMAWKNGLRRFFWKPWYG
jgi:hypothetical protein